MSEELQRKINFDYAQIGGVKDSLCNCRNGR